MLLKETERKKYIRRKIHQYITHKYYIYMHTTLLYMYIYTDLFSLMQLSTCKVTDYNRNIMKSKCYMK